MMHRSRFWMFGILSLTLVLLASSAFAAQNVGNTSQKGSLLIFPYIVVISDTGEGARDGTYTLVHISNAGPSTVKLQCIWMNEQKVRVNFDLVLTAKGSALIDARTGEVEGPTDQVNRFPRAYGPFGGFEVPDSTGSGEANKEEGELVCFAVDNASGLNQVSYNHLKGEATVIRGGDDDEVAAFEYTAWAFTARQPIGTVMGSGTLVLDGVAGYDACPQHLIVNFSPKGTELGNVGDDLEIEFGHTKLGISTCTQDLREDLSAPEVFKVTKLSLNTWNASERKFSGNFECADSTWIFKLDERDVDFDPNDIYNKAALGTKTALVKVAPVVDFRCSNDGDYSVIAPGIVGVAATEVDIEDLEDEEGSALVGTNLTGQGAVAGSILWSPVAGGDPEGN